MIYPFIYTRTKFHDYRVLSFGLLQKLPSCFVGECRAIARAAIDASNVQLQTPSWILVKTNEAILWGMACCNRLLGSQFTDKESCPVRGFFGIILSPDSNALPFDLAFFKRLYEVYVSPIWEAAASDEEVTTLFDIPFGSTQLLASKKEAEINFLASISRFFPWRENEADYISTVLATKGCNSIATNIHEREQALTIGKNNFSFQNVIMANDSGLSRIEDVFINEQVQKAIEVPNDKKIELHENDNKECPDCVNSLLSFEEDICEESMSKKTKTPYGLYVFFGLMCLILLFIGSDIWKAIYSDKGTAENVVKNLTIKNATINKRYKVGFRDSSKIESKPDWILTDTDTINNTIVIRCRPSDVPERKGIVKLNDGRSIIVVQKDSSIKKK